MIPADRLRAYQEMSTLMTQDNKAASRSAWYPYIFVGMFMVIISVNAVLLFFATGSFTGLETHHAFEEGVNYNQTLAEVEAEKKLGWSASVDATYRANPSQPEARDVLFTLFVKGPDGDAVRDLSINGEVRRPNAEKLDRDVAFTEAEGGGYEALALLPTGGRWQVRLTATRGEDTFHYWQEFDIPTEEELAERERLGWQTSIAVDSREAPSSAPVGARDVTVSVTVDDREGNPLSGLDVEAELRRTTGGKLDAPVTFRPTANGRYEAEARLPRVGRWQVRMVAKRGDDALRYWQDFEIR